MTDMMRPSNKNITNLIQNHISYPTKLSTLNTNLSSILNPNLYTLNVIRLSYLIISPEKVIFLVKRKRKKSVGTYVQFSRQALSSYKCWNEPLHPSIHYHFIMPINEPLLRGPLTWRIMDNYVSRKTKIESIKHES